MTLDAAMNYVFFVSLLKPWKYSWYNKSVEFIKIENKFFECFFVCVDITHVHDLNGWMDMITLLF